MKLKSNGAIDKLGRKIPTDFVITVRMLCPKCGYMTVWYMSPNATPPKNIIVCSKCHVPVDKCNVHNLPGFDNKCEACEKKFICASNKLVKIKA